MLQQVLRQRWWLFMLMFAGILSLHTACNCGTPGVQDGIVGEGGESGGNTDSPTTEKSAETISTDGVVTQENGPEDTAEITAEPGTETVAEVSKEPTPEGTPEASFEPGDEPTPDATSNDSSEPTQEVAPEPGPEPKAPIVVASVPKDGEQVEQPKGNPILITVTFDQDMDPSTLDTAAFDIKPLVTGKVSAGSNGKTLEFKPDQDLPLFKKYTITIKNTVTSKLGVTMAKDYTFSFETKSPGSDPTFLATFSAAGGTSTSSNGMTHHTVFGHGTVVGTTGGSGSHTVQAGFIHTFTF